MSSSQEKPIRLALIGAGIFARDVHVPSLLTHPDRFEIAAIYSRSRASAEALAEHIPNPVQLYTDLDALLARKDIEAVDIVLPIHVMSSYVRSALAAGKHLVSEKPIAADLQTARQLLATYATRRERQVWMVGENWRYEEVYLQAASLIQADAIGTPVTINWTSYSPITPDNKYYDTLWRRDGSFQGGFLLDGGVHHIAAMRLMLGEIVGVAATTRQVSPALKPLDTMVSTLEFASGVLGNYLVTYAAGATWTPTIDIVGTEGTIRVARDQLTVSRGSVEAQTSEQIDVDAFNGVEKEMLAFADAIRDGTSHRDTPEEGLRDLAVIEAMLEAARTGQRIVPAQE